MAIMDASWTRVIRGIPENGKQFVFPSGFYGRVKLRFRQNEWATVVVKSRLPGCVARRFYIMETNDGSAWTFDPDLICGANIHL